MKYSKLPPTAIRLTIALILCCMSTASLAYVVTWWGNDPVENMGPEAKAPGRLFVCAQVGALGRPLKLARMVHAVYDTGWGCELRSHFWMGLVETDLLGGLVQRVANTRWARGLALSRAAAQALEAHCHEEMSNLGRFLPSLYAREAGR